MKLSLGVLTSVVAYAIGANGFDILSLPLVGEYLTLYNLCKAGGLNTYVGVLYKDGTTVTYDYGKCYPYQVNGALAQIAVFCKPATCYSNPNPDCTGGATPPVGVPLPAFATLINAADFVQLVGQGATCQPNGLPSP